MADAPPPPPAAAAAASPAPTSNDEPKTAGLGDPTAPTPSAKPPAADASKHSSAKFVKSRSSSPSKRLLLLAFCISLGSSFNFGYNVVITGPSDPTLKEFVNSSYVNQEGAPFGDDASVLAFYGQIIAAMFWAALFSCFLIQIVADKLGRKWGCFLTNIGQGVGMALSALSCWIDSWQLFLVSRILLGIFNTIGIGISPVYIAEISPKECRGVLSMVTTIQMQSGIVLAAILGMTNVLGSADTWPWMYLVQLVWTIVCTAVLPFIPESPSYLQSHGKDQAALKSVQFYYECGEEEASAVLAASAPSSSSQTHSLFSLWKDAKARRGVLVGCVAMFACVMSGIVVINSHAVSVLKDVGLDPESASYANVVICAISVAGVIFSSFIIEKAGRRKLALLSNGLIVIINIIICVLMAIFEGNKNETWLGYTLVTSICIYIFVFTTGSCPIAFFVYGEMVDTSARGAASLWVNVLFCLCRSIILTVFQSAQKAFSELFGGTGMPYIYFLLFVPPVFVSVILLYFYMPETKNRSLEEVQEAIKQLPRLRKRGDATGKEEEANPPPAAAPSGKEEEGGKPAAAK